MMKIRMIALSLMLVMLLGTVAQAAGPMRAPSTDLRISFSGTTATCETVVKGSAPADRISVTMKLWKGGTCLKTWVNSGTYRVKLNETATVSKGKTYKLTVDYTINGVHNPQKSITKTCP